MVTYFQQSHCLSNLAMLLLIRFSSTLLIQDISVSLLSPDVMLFSFLCPLICHKILVLSYFFNFISSTLSTYYYLLQKYKNLGFSLSTKDVVLQTDSETFGFVFTRLQMPGFLEIPILHLGGNQIA